MAPTPNVCIYKYIHPFIKFIHYVYSNNTQKRIPNTKAGGSQTIFICMLVIMPALLSQLKRKNWSCQEGRGCLNIRQLLELHAQCKVWVKQVFRQVNKIKSIQKRTELLILTEIHISFKCVGHFVWFKWRKRITTLSDLLSTHLPWRIKYTYICL